MGVAYVVEKKMGAMHSSILEQAKLTKFIE
jgi:hypothetical protein